MKRINSILLLLFTLEIAHAATNAAVKRAEFDYRRELKNLEDEAEKKIEKAKAYYAKTLEREIKNADRKDNSAEVSRLKAKLEALEENSPVQEVLKEYWLDKEYTSAELVAKAAEAPKLNNENAIKVLLAQVDACSEQHQKLLLSRAVNLGSLEAGAKFIKMAQWDAAASVNTYTERFKAWKTNDEIVDGIPVPVIYAELLANWATRTGALSRAEKEAYFKEAGEILKQHSDVHPIVANEYLWLWDKVNPGKTKEDTAYVELRNKTELALIEKLEETKGKDRTGLLLTLCELYDKQRLYKKTEALYEEAANLGCAQAQYVAGLYYLNGRWERDQKKGKAYLEKALLQGHEHAEREIRERGLYNKEYNGESINLSFNFMLGNEFKHSNYNLRAYDGEYTLNVFENSNNYHIHITEETYARVSNTIRPLVIGKNSRSGGGNSVFVSLHNRNKNQDFSTFIEMAKLPKEALNLTALFEKQKKKTPVIPETISGDGELMTYACNWHFPAEFGPDGTVRRLDGVDADIIIMSQETNSGPVRKLQHADNIKIYAAAKKVMQLPNQQQAMRRGGNYFTLRFEPIDNFGKSKRYRCNLDNDKAIPQEVIDFLVLATEMGKKYGRH